MQQVRRPALKSCSRQTAISFDRQNRGSDDPEFTRAEGSGKLPFWPQSRGIILEASAERASDERARE